MQLSSVHGLVGGDDFECQGDVRSGEEEYFVERKKKVFRGNGSTKVWSHLCRGKFKKGCGDPH